jgi:N-acetylglucosaminyl-diphospho-decaprenol L-rhamnosyltransferase
MSGRRPGAPLPSSAGPRDAPEVAAVVVAYESGSHLRRCVGDLRADGASEVVVVDNGSRDGSLEELAAAFPDVPVIRPGRNLGYGAAANRGMAATGSPTVLVCNPDLEVQPGALSALAAALGDDPAVGVAGPLIRDAEGIRYPSARTFPSLVDASGHGAFGMFVPGNRFTRAYQNASLDEAEATTPVDWVSGACFLARRSALEEVGGFDEAYFMYVEDVDLCWRLGRAGWTVAYVPGAEVTHVQGVSTDRHPYRMIVEHHRSLLRFASRSSRSWRRVLLPLIALAIAARGCVALAVRRAGTPLRLSGAGEHRL